MIEQLLSRLGLKEKDIHIYLALVRLGAASASAIAREVSLPRQTVYSILAELVKEEIIEQSDRRGVKQFAADPSQLIEVMNKRQHELEKNKQQLEKELPKLVALQKNQAPFLKVQYYEGKDGMKRLLESILEIYKRGKSKEFRGYGVNQFKEALGDYFFDWAKKRFSYGVATKLFIGRGPDDFGITGSNNSLGRVITRLNMDPQNAGVYLVHNRVYLFSFQEQVGVMIESASISQLLQAVFDDHWARV